MKTWVKSYTETTHDPKMLTLTWAQRGIWAALLNIAGEIDDRDEDGIETGALDTIEYTALRIRCDPGEFGMALAAFQDRGMVTEKDGILYLPNYAKRQGRAPSDRKAAVTERVKRYRAERGASVKRGCNEDVTSVKRGVTASDSDSDSDTETDSDTEVSGSPEREPEPAPAPNRRSDPRSKHPAIQAARAATGARKYPPFELYDAIIAALGECPDCERLDRCRQAWVTRGYNPNAWTWATEWYAQGVPERTRGPTPATVPRADGRPTGAAARRAWAERGNNGSGE